MRRSGLAGAELARGLDDDLDSVVAPRQLRRIPLGTDRDLVAVDGDSITEVFDILAQRPEGAVVAKKSGHRGGVGDIIDRHDLKVGVLGCQHIPQVVPADPTKSVDPDPDAHNVVCDGVAAGDAGTAR